MRNNKTNIKEYANEAEKARQAEINAKIAAYQRKKFRARIIILAVAAIVVIGGATAAAKFIGTIKPPDIIMFEPTVTFDPSIQSPPPTADPENADEDPAIDKIPGRKDGVYTFVIVGEDQGTGNTDTIIVGAYDDLNKKLNLVNLPRDTLVNVSWSTKKASTIYYLPNLKSADVPEGYTLQQYTPIHRANNLKTHIKDLLGFAPDNYFVVTLKAFERLVDAIGGVDFDVPINMNYDDPTQNLYIHISKGMQHLNGHNAVLVARNRHGYPNADIGRINTQQALLKAIAKQTLTLSNITKVNEFAEIFAENVQTDMTLGNLIWYANRIMKLDSAADISFATVPANYNDSVKGLSYCTIYVNEWLAMINDKLNPLLREITETDVSILTRNSSGTLYSTSGTIAGGSNSFYNNIKSTPAPSATPVPDPAASESIAPEDGGTDSDNGLFYVPSTDDANTTPTQPTDPAEEISAEPII
ncbi:MAG: LCP family protein [Oscillospiraceae bacterium]|jgi:LCP family protein required for cell wall assembly|nr:LCP family protein [Oscillospiraceae bacterium]